MEEVDERRVAVYKETVLSLGFIWNTALVAVFSGAAALKPICPELSLEKLQ